MVQRVGNEGECRQMRGAAYKKGCKENSVHILGGDMVRVVQSYKYLGCTVIEHMDCREMVGERAKAGRGALGAWIWRCRVSVGEVKGRTFVKLLEALVGSVLMYGAEVWGCWRQLDYIEQIQLRACRIFLGVGRVHSKTSLQMEMGAPTEAGGQKKMH